MNVETHGDRYVAFLADGEAPLFRDNVLGTAKRIAQDHDREVEGFVYRAPDEYDAFRRDPERYRDRDPRSGAFPNHDAFADWLTTRRINTDSATVRLHRTGDWPAHTDVAYDRLAHVRMEGDAAARAVVDLSQEPARSRLDAAEVLDKYFPALGDRLD